MRITAHLSGESKKFITNSPRDIALVDLMSFLIRNCDGDEEWLTKVSNWADKTKKGQKRHLVISLLDNGKDEFWIEG